MSVDFDWKSVIRNFAVSGELISCENYGGGHINDTYLIVTGQEQEKVRYILQRINHLIFKNPEGLMKNIKKVTEHIREKKSSAFKTPLYLVDTLEGGIFHCDHQGNYWRLYNFIEGARTYDAIESVKQAYEGARAFGLFLKELNDFPGEELYETIPGFHNTPERYKNFEQAVQEGCPQRKVKAAQLIEQYRSFEKFSSAITDLLHSGKIPLRVTHNDTKLNNVMLDDETSEGVCVIDLDTLMPGSALYDFGDFIRTAARIGAEDEPDLNQVSFSEEMYKASLRGYLEAAGDALNETEKDHLALSSLVISYEIGLRFLTDYLQGDIYFKTSREHHNLERARVQFKMAKEIHTRLDKLNQLIKEVI